MKFCDNPSSSDSKIQHNADATTNQQNIRCNQQSVWEVIRAHADYAQMDPPGTIADTTPNFRVVRASVSTIVLVLDSSGSMIGSRTAKLKQGCQYFLNSVLPDGINVAIVEFDSDATRLAGLTQISSETKQELLTYVAELDASGGTSIGSGILEALDVLSEASIVGGILVVVSDGQQNTGALIEQIQSQVLDSGVTVHTVAITNAADTALSFISGLTGGIAYITRDDDESNAINDAFQAIADRLRNSNASISLSSEATVIAGNGVHSGSAVIDENLGLDTRITFDYEFDAGVSISIQDAGNSLYDTSYCSNSTFRVLTCDFPGVTERGMWFYNVSNLNTNQQRVSVIVTSKPRDPDILPIVAHAFWGIGELNFENGDEKQSIYATVFQGNLAVLHATVQAVVQADTPGSMPHEIELHDNGNGADLHSGDGIYAAYFTDFMDGDVRYSLMVKVYGSEVTTVVEQTIVGESSTPGRRKREAESQGTGAFQRVTSGGSFIASNTQVVSYPPGRITDLRVIAVDADARQVTLQWTAQGRWLDVGAAAEYEIRRDNDSDLSAGYELIQQTDIITGDLSSPENANTVETFVVQLPDVDATYFLAVVSLVDGTGPVSNIVTASTRPITASDLGNVEGPLITTQPSQLPTEEPPTEERLTEEPSNEEPSYTEEPSTEEPLTEEPPTDERPTEEPLTEEPPTEEPPTEEPSTEEPPTEEPPTEEPSTEEPLTDEPPTKGPSTEEPPTEEPPTKGPSTEEPSTEEPLTDEPPTEEPFTEEPLTKDPTTEEPSTEEPLTEEPPTEEPPTEEPSNEEPPTEEPPTEEPPTEGPPTEEPQTEEKLPVALVAGFSVVGFAILVVFATVYLHLTNTKSVKRRHDRNRATRPQNKRSSVLNRLDPYSYFSKNYERPRAHVTRNNAHSQLSLHGNYSQAGYNQSVAPSVIYHQPFYDSHSYASFDL